MVTARAYFWRGLRQPGQNMPTEQLTYDQFADRLGTSKEAARAIVKRNRLPRSRSNDGKTLVAVDLADIQHKPLPTRTPAGHHAVAALKARIVALEVELSGERQRSAGHRADYERERERADRMVTVNDRLVGELANLRTLLEQGGRMVTLRTSAASAPPTGMAPVHSPPPVKRRWWRWS